MRLLGVEIKHPSPSGLVLAAFVILTFIAVNLVFGEGIGRLFPSLAAFAAGTIAASFGISPLHGWRASLLLLGIATIAFVAVAQLTGQTIGS
jgi:hypothetical protein